MRLPCRCFCTWKIYLIFVFVEKFDKLHSHSAVDIRFDANRTYNFNLTIGESMNNGLSTESLNKSTSPW